METLKTSLFDFIRLLLAGVICTLTVITFLSFIPINNIPNVIPQYVIETTNNLSEDQKKIVDELYANGDLIDTNGLYGEIIEYYHFLVFLLFALLALVASFVYLQIRSETSAKINRAVDEGIVTADIEGKVYEEIDNIEIDKIITEQIDEASLAERISADVINTTILGVQTGFDADLLSIKQEVENLNGLLASVVGGLDEELEKVKLDINDIKSVMQEDE